MPYNPCCCWNLRDGCMVIGIYTTIYGIIQLGIFGWQTQVVKDLKDKTANFRLTQYGSYDQYSQHFPGYYERFFETDRERFFLALFIIQIIKIIVDFTVLCGGVALIYGIQTRNKHLVWPWIPCMCVSILFSFGYCAMWWSSNVNSYWMILSVCIFLFIPINVYCLLCVSEFLRRMVKGHDLHSSYYPPDKAKRIIVTDSDGSGLPESKVFYQDDDNDYGYAQRRVVQPPYRPAIYEEKPFFKPIVTEKETFINGSESSTVEEIPPKVDQFDEILQTSPAPPSYEESLHRGHIETTFDVIGNFEPPPQPTIAEGQQTIPPIETLQRYLESMEEVQPDILVPTEIGAQMAITEVSERKKRRQTKSKSKVDGGEDTTAVGASEKRRHHSAGDKSERSRKSRSHRHRADSSSSDSSSTRVKKEEKSRRAKAKSHDKAKSDGKSSQRRHKSEDDLKARLKEEKRAAERRLPPLPVDSDSLEQPKVPRRDLLAHYYPPPPPQYSFPPGAICIPQQFTVPTAQFSGPKPTKLQINSEITVTYSSNRAAQLPFYSAYQDRNYPIIQTLPEGSSPDTIEVVHSNSEDSGRHGTTKI